jgi:hypothetical protein
MHGREEDEKKKRVWVKWHAIVVEDDYTLGLVN